MKQKRAVRLIWFLTTLPHPPTHTHCLLFAAIWTSETPGDFAFRSLQQTLRAAWFCIAGHCSKTSLSKWCTWCACEQKDTYSRLAKAENTKRWNQPLGLLLFSIFLARYRTVCSTLSKISKRHFQNEILSILVACKGPNLWPNFVHRECFATKQTEFSVPHAPKSSACRNIYLFSWAHLIEQNIQLTSSNLATWPVRVNAILSWSSPGVVFWLNTGNDSAV